MEILLVRTKLGNNHISGELFTNGKKIGYTQEGRNCIPGGEYQIVLSYSDIFKRVTPEIENVPEFKDVRIHEGGIPEIQDGGIILGKVRAGEYVSDYPGVNVMLIRMIGASDAKGEDSVIVITDIS